MEILKTIATSPFFAIFTGVVGFLAGHWFSVLRDKRREFNSAADKLAGAIHRSKLGKIPLVEFDDFSRFLNRRNLRRFSETLRKYTEASQCDYNPDDESDPFTYEAPMKDAVAAEKFLAELKAYTKRR